MGSCKHHGHGGKRTGSPVPYGEGIPRGTGHPASVSGVIKPHCPAAQGLAPAGRHLLSEGPVRPPVASLWELR